MDLEAEVSTRLGEQRWVNIPHQPYRHYSHSVPAAHSPHAHSYSQ
jgi:hypothetical protein